MSITIQNSWHFSGGLWQDPELQRVKDSPLRYRPEPIKISELKTDTLWTLRGARRSGKTVSLKLLIAALVENEICPVQKIIWTSVENLRKSEQLDAHLRQIIEKYQPQFLFCDEITSIPGWQNILKKLRDEGKLSQTCTVLTGSSAFDLKKGSERLAGRKGIFESTDRVLLPMSFVDFLAQDPALTVEEYLTCGGFPFRVEGLLQAKKTGKPFDPLFGTSVLDDIYFYEFGRRRLDRNLALEVLFRLSQIQPHALSYSGFAKALNVKTETAQKYLDVLGDCFLLATIFSYDTSKARVALKKDRKFVWMDSSLAFLANSVGQGDRPKLESLAEQIVGAHLLRNFELRLFEGVSAPRQVFTWKSKNGNEIDYLILNRSLKLSFPIEVKYQNIIAPSDFASMEKSFKMGKLISKNESILRNLSSAVGLHKFLRSGSKEILSQF